MLEITPADLAENAGMHTPQLYQIMAKGNCEIATLERLSDALGFKLSEFIALGE